MRLNGFRCDQCGTEHLVHIDMGQAWNERLPVTWVILLRGTAGKKPTEEAPLFCSEGCLTTYLDKRHATKEAQ